MLRLGAVALLLVGSSCRGSVTRGPDIEKLKGQVVVGMSESQVREVMGVPIRRKEVSVGSGVDTVWTYYRQHSAQGFRWLNDAIMTVSLRGGVVQSVKTDFFTHR